MVLIMLLATFSSDAEDVEPHEFRKLPTCRVNSLMKLSEVVSTVSNASAIP